LGAFGGGIIRGRAVVVGTQEEEGMIGALREGVYSENINRRRCYSGYIRRGYVTGALVGRDVPVNMVNVGILEEEENVMMDTRGKGDVFSGGWWRRGDFIVRHLIVRQWIY
jgi:hypothetical protein